MDGIDQSSIQGTTEETIARGASGRPDPVDADMSRRPGVPMYKPAGTSAPMGKPPLDQQEPTVRILIGPEVGRLTPVFGTCQPPRGLSGLVRRAAYRIPDHSAGRWMLLLLGDRVDIWESRVRRHPLLAGLALAAFFGTRRAMRGRRRRAWRKWLET